MTVTPQETNKTVSGHRVNCAIVKMLWLVRGYQKHRNCRTCDWRKSAMTISHVWYEPINNWCLTSSSSTLCVVEYLGTRLMISTSSEKVWKPRLTSPEKVHFDLPDRNCRTCDWRKSAMIISHVWYEPINWCLTSSSSHSQQFLAIVAPIGPRAWNIITYLLYSLQIRHEIYNRL